MDWKEASDGRGKVAIAVGFYRCVFCGRGTVSAEARPLSNRRRPHWSVTAPCPMCGRLGTMGEMEEPEAYVVPADGVPKALTILRDVMKVEFGELIEKVAS